MKHSFLAACVVLLAACGTADPSELFVDSMTESVKILEGITDKASAEAATDDWIDAQSKMGDFDEAISSMSKAEKDALSKEINEKHAELGQKFEAEMMRVFGIPGALDVLDAATKEMREAK